jgi:hypothetical protein
MFLLYTSSAGFQTSYAANGMMPASMSPTLRPPTPEQTSTNFRKLIRFSATYATQLWSRQGGNELL